jgi:hypothetical protein
VNVTGHNYKDTVSKKTLFVFSILIAITILFVGYEIYSVYKAKKTDSLPTTKETVTNKEYGVSFTYLKGDGGFTMVEPNGQDKGIKKAYLILPTDEFAAYQKSTNVKEAPAALSVFVFSQDGATTTSKDESRITALQNWANDNSTLTSMKQAKGTPDIVDLDGAKALHYTADGLFQQDIYLVSYRGYVYMFAGQYNKTTDKTYTAFQDLIHSVTFE